MKFSTRWRAACSAYFHPRSPGYRISGGTAVIAVALMLVTFEVARKLAWILPAGPMQAMITTPQRWPALASDILQASPPSPLVPLREELSQESRQAIERLTANPDADGRSALRLAYRDWTPHHSVGELNDLLGDAVRIAPGEQPIYVMFIVGKIAAILLILGYLRWAEGITVKDLGLTRVKLRRSFSSSALLLLIWFPVVMAINVACQAWMPGKVHSAFSLVEEGSIASLALVFVAAAVVAPFIEELIFRGVIQVWLMQMMGIWSGIIGASVLFGFTHMPEWPAPIPLSVLGVGMAIAFLRRRSLWASIFFHTGFNAINLLFAWAYLRFATGS